MIIIVNKILTQKNCKETKRVVQNVFIVYKNSWNLLPTEIKSHHIKHCEQEEKIVERLLNFLAENGDKGDEVATETDQGHGQEQHSLQQEG